MSNSTDRPYDQLLKLTDSTTNESVYVDPFEIVALRQEPADNLCDRKTNIMTIEYKFAVKEEADEIALYISRSRAASIRFAIDMYHRTPQTSSNKPRQMLLLLTDFHKNEPLFVDPSSIVRIQQLPGDDTYNRRTAISTTDGSFFVREESMAIVRASNRGYYTTGGEITVG